MAHNYSEEDGGRTSDWVTNFGPATNVFGPVFTDGGLVSTATDLARFGNALLGGRLVGPATVALMTNTRRATTTTGSGSRSRKPIITSGSATTAPTAVTRARTGPIASAT
jgi:CubicO group peptidase (beta-lactamase class C family)